MINILFHIPLYVDVQLSGGEKTAQDFAEYLKSTGDYNVRIIADRTNKNSFNNIDLYSEDNTDVPLQHHYKWANVVFTHLGKQGKAVNYSKMNKVPICIYMHNTNGSVLAKARKEIGVIYNSYFTEHRIAADFTGNKSALIRPILKLDTSFNSNGKYITMINLNENKGGLLLKQIAESLPEYDFLAITGGYAKQFTHQPKNVKVLPQQEDMSKVYKDTKLLIMPSNYESYGRTAAESIGYGIPVLYSDTNTALEEVVGNAGEPVKDRNNINSWVKGIRWIDNNIDHYRGRAINQRLFLLQQIERDKDNFKAFIKNLIFDKK
jgi:glycosyltransferase involved in cell wall biosynthesis